MDLARDERHDADDEHRYDDQKPDVFLHVGGAEDAAVLIAKVTSMSTTPMKKVALSENDTGPSDWLNSDQLRKAGVAAAVTAVTASAGAVPAWLAIQATTSGDVAV